MAGIEGAQAAVEEDGGDLETIREVLSIHHVPVVASLHWDKLHSILHSLCDRIATQALRLEKAEEQGKSFFGLKDELGQLCQNAVKEMKDANASELEQQQRWSQMVEEHLQRLQQGMEANSNGLRRLDDLDVPSCFHRLDALEEASKNFNRLDALEESTKNLEAIHASQPITLDSLNQKLEELVVDFEEQSEKLHTLEDQNEKLKLKLEQMAKSHASDLEALQQYCRNLRSDFELKFLVDVGKLPTTADGEIFASSKAKLEAAVAELQNRMQKKADVDDVDKMSQSTLIVKDALEKMQSNFIELQSQFKRLSVGSRRASRVSVVGGLGYQDNQVLVTEPKTTTVEELSPRLMDELTKDVKAAIEKHDKEIMREGLKGNKFEAKGSVKAIWRLSEDISNLFCKVHEFDTTALALKDGLSLKADKLDLQRLARYVKEQLQRPENTVFTTKPLYGFRCMSCDHQVEKLSPVPGEHLPTNRMPPQVLPMLAAERIFAFDRRGANGSGFFNPAQANKSWSGSFVKRGAASSARRPTSPRKA